MHKYKRISDIYRKICDKKLMKGESRGMKEKMGWFLNTAGVTRATGVFSPPPWLMLTSLPSENEIFNPEDSQKLEEKYGIKLNFAV